MAIEHIRNLGKYGVLTDLDAYSLPPEAFSFGVNVRFRNGKITGAPVFRNVQALSDDPRFTCATQLEAGHDSIFVGYLNGTVDLYSSGALTDYTVSGYTPSEADAVWTNTVLGNVLYINRSDRAPWYIRTSDTTFQDISGDQWDATWSCRLLRTCAGALVALNVTKGAVNTGTMVKTSSIPQVGTVPASWDITDPATLATENILAEMQSPIVDAQTFGRHLVIYGLREAWLMQADGSIEVYNYSKLPFQKGALNANCSIEIAGTHYVFGPDDIWKHDGTSEVSICDQKVRDFIYGSLNLKKANRCFVVHNPQMKELSFCYVSGDRAVKFLTGSEGCNRSAVYNYQDGTWTFDDLPFVYSSSNANLDTALTYATATQTYASIGGTYQDLEDGVKRTTLYVGDEALGFGLQTSLYAFDLYGVGSSVAYAVDVNATGPRYLERDGIDLDELNVDLRGYKMISAVYPQARLGANAAPLQISYGAADYFNDTPAFSDYQPYDGDTLYKLDYMCAGRYLSMRILFEDYKELSITGFDLDMKVTGNR